MRANHSRPVLTVEEVIRRLAAIGSKKARAKMSYWGVTPKKAFGISTPKLRKLGREIGRNHELALQLWDSGIHEAQGLATFIEEPQKVTGAQMESWARDFHSWDIVDAACYQCFDASRFAYAKAFAWSKRK